MAISGENGAVYFNEEITDTATTGTLVFTTGKTITSCGGVLNFESEGYTTGMLVTLSGCTYNLSSTGDATTANNRIFTFTAVSTDSVTVSEAMVAADAEAGAVKFTEAEPGVPVLGFYNWSLSYAGDALETTNFDHTSGERTYIAGMTSWTVAADKYFQSANNEVDDWVGGTCEIRLFTKYASTPSGSDISQYWKGDTVVTGLDETTPVDALISQGISLQGDGTLELKTQSDPWSCGIS